MSLKNQYYDGVSGLASKLDAAHDAGVALIGTGTGLGQWDTISTGLQTNAANGLKKFTVTIPVTYNPSNLRANKGDNLVLKAFLSGVVEALSQQDIYNFECEPTLNTSDTVNTSVDLNFTFS